ncbi:MAG: hypothetical protein RLZZ129_581 [Verrucomicrobiota bacterium]|jgi:phage baseplate assembly protein gpV
MLEGCPLRSGERRRLTVDVAHEVALAVAGDAVAEDEVVHAAADVDRINLHEAVVREGGGDIGGRGIQQQRPAHEAAGVGGGNLERSGRHARD